MYLFYSIVSEKRVIHFNAVAFSFTHVKQSGEV